MNILAQSGKTKRDYTGVPTRQAQETGIYDRTVKMVKLVVLAKLSLTVTITNKSNTRVQVHALTNALLLCSRFFSVEFSNFCFSSLLSHVMSE